MAITKNELLTVIQKEPNLCDFGFREKTNPKFQEDRADIADNLHQVQLCIDWLQGQKTNKILNRRIGSSYALKHKVERWANDYVSNGAFIAACIFSGINYKRIEGTPNIWTNLS